MVKIMDNALIWDVMLVPPQVKFYADRSRGKSIHRFNHTSRIDEIPEYTVTIDELDPYDCDFIRWLYGFRVPTKTCIARYVSSQLPEYMENKPIVGIKRNMVTDIKLSTPSR